MKLPVQTLTGPEGAVRFSPGCLLQLPTAFWQIYGHFNLTSTSE